MIVKQINPVHFMWQIHEVSMHSLALSYSLSMICLKSVIQWLFVNFLSFTLFFLLFPYSLLSSFSVSLFLYSSSFLSLCYVYTLQWRHNERDGISNHQRHDCLLNPLFMRRSMKTSKLHVTGLCEGNSPVTGEFPAQKASNAENVSI